HGVALPEKVSLVQRYSLACPAIPTCGLAICESERALPSVVDDLESLLREMDLEDSAFTIRMTGCPNGCVRPYQSDIGLVGRSGDKYLLYLGGRLEGDRLNFPVKDLVSRDDVAKVLRPVFKEYKDNRKAAESFGDFCDRLGQDRLKALTETAV
ncbi:MAG: NADPH-dependent assimilatory sulfite reductase hemoprotein subunit, partial [Gemmataceae bacterium]